MEQLKAAAEAERGERAADRSERREGDAATGGGGRSRRDRGRRRGGRGRARAGDGGADHDGSREVCVCTGLRCIIPIKHHLVKGYMG